MLSACLALLSVSLSDSHQSRSQPLSHAAALPASLALIRVGWFSPRLGSLLSLFQARRQRSQELVLVMNLHTERRYRSRVCSFYVRGECTSGAECPYRHDMPETGELSQQNIKDCYYGVNDPVAHKLLNKAHEMPSLVPPEDESIRTLYVGGLDDRITEQDLRDHFYAHGEIESIKMVLQQACAFVSYTTREVTEKAAEELANKLVIKGLRLKLLWGRPQVQKPMCYFNIPLPPPPLQPERTFSPSMDPQRMGAVVPSQQGDSTMPSVLGENRRGLEQQHGGHYAAAAAYPYPGMPLPSPQRQIYKP